MTCFDILINPLMTCIKVINSIEKMWKWSIFDWNSNVSHWQICFTFQFALFLFCHLKSLKRSIYLNGFLNEVEVFIHTLILCPQLTLLSKYINAINRRNFQSYQKVVNSKVKSVSKWSKIWWSKEPKIFFVPKKTKKKTLNVTTR